MEETLNILRLLLRRVTGNRRRGLFQNTRTPNIMGDSILPQSFSVRLGICWGDDMRNIIYSAKKKKVKHFFKVYFFLKLLCIDIYIILYMHIYAHNIMYYAVLHTDIVRRSKE